MEGQLSVWQGLQVPVSQTQAQFPFAVQPGVWKVQQLFILIVNQNFGSGWNSGSDPKRSSAEQWQSVQVQIEPHISTDVNDSFVFSRILRTFYVWTADLPFEKQRDLFIIG